MPLINAPHHFIAQCFKEMLALKVDHIKSEISLFYFYFNVGADLCVSGIQRNIKTVAAALNSKTDHFII